MHKYIVKGKTGLFVSLSSEQKDTPITVLGLSLEAGMNQWPQSHGGMLAGKHAAGGRQ